MAGRNKIYLLVKVQEALAYLQLTLSFPNHRKALEIIPNKPET